MECLLKLRECCIAGNVPKLIDGDETVVMAGKQYPLTAKTAWRSTNATATAPAQFYDLRTLLLLLEMKDHRVGEYIRAATSRKVPFVSNVHRTDLMDYLQGNSDSSQHIEAAAVPDIGLVGAAMSAPQRSISSSGDAPSAKRPRTSESSSGAAAGSSSSSSGRRSSLTDDQLRSAKQKHAERLGGRGASARGAGLILGSDSSSAAGSAASASALGMSSDKLLELRTKRLAQKRSTFSLEAGGDDPLENDEDAPVDPAFLDADREIVGRITAREARVTDRNAVLRRPGKDFKFALDYYTEVRRREKEEAAAKDGSKAGTAAGSSSNNDKKRGRSENPIKAFGFGAPPARK
jgi:Paf1 complex subunit CDC73 N-terminal